MQSKIVSSSESIRLYTESFGQAVKTACVLIAGAMAPCRFWTDEFCSALASGGSLVIRYDHRDIGLSSSVDWEKEPYTLADLATDAISILDAYGIEAAYFIGHSMGGHICQQLAVDYPKRVIGITIISSGPIGATEDTDLPLSDLEKAILAKTWKLFLERKDSGDLEERIQGFLLIWKYLNGSVSFDEEAARAYTIDLLTRTKHPVQAGNNHELVMRTLAETLPTHRNLTEQIRVPTLIIHGDLDPIALPRDAQALTNAVAGSRLIKIPDMGHMIFNRKLESEIASMIRSHMQ